MAEIAGAFGVPHTPVFPFFVNRDGPDCEIARYFGMLRAEFDRIRPDMIVMFDTDHLNTFFFDNLPVFAIGVADGFRGPNDEVRDVPMRDIRSDAGLGAHIRSEAIRSGFDPSMTQEFSVDHSVAVPLHFITPKWDVPVVPIFVSGHVPPLPSARRCHEFGRAVRRAIESFPGGMRVAIMGSGSFSLDVWGPRIAPGRTDGVPDPEWARRICSLLETMQVDTLIEEATEEKMLGAGNVGGELLNWIAMLGSIGTQKPLFVQPQMQNGHAYAAWPGN